MGNSNWLKNHGLTNSDSEDIGTLSSSPTQWEYAYFCSSFKCAGQKHQIQKFISKEWHPSCPDCKGIMHSKRVKGKSR